jgi:hypothetical protein
VAKKNALKAIAKPSAALVSPPEHTETPDAEQPAPDALRDPITSELPPPPDLVAQSAPRGPMGVPLLGDTAWLTEARDGGPTTLLSSDRGEAALAQAAYVEAFQPVPTRSTVTCILGRVAVDGERVVVGPPGERNSTRWIFDVELAGSTAVELAIKLLGHSTGQAVHAPLVSFTLGAGNGNFYVARPHIVQEGPQLTLKTVKLPRDAVVRFRVSIDTYHSAHR